MRRKTAILCRSILSLAAAIALQAQAADARYMVYLNSFEVQKYEQEAIDAGYVQPQVPDNLSEQERSEYIARNMDALTRSPGVERLTDELVREFSLGEVDKGGRHLPAFFVLLDDDKVAALRRSGRVVSVTKVGNGEDPDLELGLVDEIDIGTAPVDDVTHIPHKLSVAAVYSETNPDRREQLIDGKFYDGIDWNAGAHWGSIVLDLGSQKNVKGIRVMMRSSSNGGVLNFAAHGGNTIHITGPGKAVIPDNPIAWLNTTDQYDLVPYYIPLSGNWRYIMLQAHNVPSWLSYSEVEVYGF